MDRRPDLSREEALAALQRSDQRYRSLIEGMEMFVWLADPAGALRSDMPAWRAITGQTVEELLGDGWVEAIHPDDRPGALAAWGAAVRTGSMYATEYRIRAAAGDHRRLQVRGVPVHGADGRVREFVGVCTDVTEQRALEASLDRERHLLQHVVDRTPTGLALVWGSGHVFRLVNDACRAMLPPGRELLGRPFAEALPETAATGLPAIDHVHRTGEPMVAGDYALPFDDERAYRGRRHYSVTLCPVPDVDGSPGGVLLIGSERTDEVRRRAVLLDELDQERTIAETLQRALFPARLPSVDGLQVAVRYRPAGPNLLAGGDWYDVLRLPGGRAAVTVGDVAGHGVAAATVMGQLRAAVRAHALDPDAGPAEVVRRVAGFTLAHEPGEMATVIYGEVDPAAGSLVLARAGHMPAAVLRPGQEPELVWVEDRSPPLGAPDARFGQDTVDGLVPGSTAVLFTDGLVERRGEPIDAGLGRLLETLRSHGHAPLETLCDELLGSAGADDDVALLVLRTS